MTPPSAERQSTLQDRSSFFPLPPPSSSVPSPSPSPSSSAFARLVHERVSTRPLAMASETHLTIFLFEKRLLTSTLIPATGTCRQPPPLRTPSSPSLPFIPPPPPLLSSPPSPSSRLGEKIRHRGNFQTDCKFHVFPFNFVCAGPDIRQQLGLDINFI